MAESPTRSSAPKRRPKAISQETIALLAAMVANQTKVDFSPERARYPLTRARRAVAGSHAEFLALLQERENDHE